MLGLDPLSFQGVGGVNNPLFMSFSIVSSVYHPLTWCWWVFLLCNRPCRSRGKGKGEREKGKGDAPFPFCPSHLPHLYEIFDGEQEVTINGDFPPFLKSEGQ